MGRLLCIGDLNVDLAITLRHELANGSDTDGTVEMTGGGSAANVAAWAVSIGHHRSVRRTGGQRQPG